MKKLILAALVAALGSTVALAEAGFADVDMDGSGDVTLTEAKAVWVSLTDDIYDAADANGDARVDRVEYEAFLAAHPPV
jgi:hypothetical protein